MDRIWWFRAKPDGVHARRIGVIPLWGYPWSLLFLVNFLLAQWVGVRLFVGVRRADKAVEQGEWTVREWSFGLLVPVLPMSGWTFTEDRERPLFGGYVPRNPKRFAVDVPAKREVGRG